MLSLCHICENVQKQMKRVSLLYENMYMFFLRLLHQNHVLFVSTRPYLWHSQPPNSHFCAGKTINYIFQQVGHLTTNFNIHITLTNVRRVFVFATVVKVVKTKYNFYYYWMRTCTCFFLTRLLHQSYAIFCLNETLPFALEVF